MSLEHQQLSARPSPRPSRRSPRLASRSRLYLVTLAAVVVVLLRQSNVSSWSSARLLDGFLLQKEFRWTLDSFVGILQFSPASKDHTSLKDLNDVYNRLQLQCSDPLWCSIPIPESSHFHFDLIDTSKMENQIRWLQAKIDAASGKPLLLERVMRAFPSPFDFLDGDIHFRRMHQKMDMFIDKSNWFNYLIDSKHRHVPTNNIPPPYDFYAGNRAPIVSVGYTGFDKNLDANYFDGANSNTYTVHDDAAKL